MHFHSFWFHWNSRAHAVGLLAMSFGHQNALVPSRAFEINMKTLIHFSDHSPLHFSTFRQKQRQLATVSYKRKKKKALKTEWLRCLTKEISSLNVLGYFPTPRALHLLSACPDDAPGWSGELPRILQISVWVTCPLRSHWWSYYCPNIGGLLSVPELPFANLWPCT